MLYFQSHLLVQHIKLLLFYLKHEEVKILENLWSVFAKTRVAYVQNEERFSPLFSLRRS